MLGRDICIRVSPFQAARSCFSGRQASPISGLVARTKLSATLLAKDRINGAAHLYGRTLSFHQAALPVAINSYLPAQGDDPARQGNIHQGVDIGEHGAGRYDKRFVEILQGCVAVSARVFGSRKLFHQCCPGNRCHLVLPIDEPRPDSAAVLKMCL